MSSRAWTEVATGAEARSIRSWVRRAALPILRGWFVVLILLVLAGLLYGLLLSPPADGPRCFECQPAPQERRDLLDLIF